MPIRPDQRVRYPTDWRTISEGVRAGAGHRCEECGVDDRAWGWRDAGGAFHPLDQATVRGWGVRPPFLFRPDGEQEIARVIEIVLTVAHLNHQPEDNAAENLRALCQRCHLGHDRAYHQAVRAQRQRAAMATPDMALLPADHEVRDAAG